MVLLVSRQGDPDQGRAPDSGPLRGAQRRVPLPEGAHQTGLPLQGRARLQRPHAASPCCRTRSVSPHSRVELGHCPLTAEPDSVSVPSRQGRTRPVSPHGRVELSHCPLTTGLNSVSVPSQQGRTRSVFPRSRVELCQCPLAAGSNLVSVPSKQGRTRSVSPHSRVLARDEESLNLQVIIFLFCCC